MGNHFPKNKTKGNLLIRVAAVLFCLTLFSTYIVAGLLARYSTSTQSGDYARVAKFSIEGSGKLLQALEVAIFPGEEAPADLVITNNSEVAVEYTVTVTNETNNLPLIFRMGKADSEPKPIGDGTAFTDQQLPGSHTDKYTLYIEWPAEKNDLSLMGMVDYITVTVTATQID